MEGLLKNILITAIVTLAAAWATYGTRTGRRKYVRPEKIARKYIIALSKRDYCLMRKYAVANEQTSIEEFEERVNEWLPEEGKEALRHLPKSKNILASSTINESDPTQAHATISYLSKQLNQEATVTIDIYLIKENYEWKVNQVSFL